jgi:transmembrane protein 231
MESLAVIEASNPVPGASVYASGELRVFLKQPLNHKGVDTRYNVCK